MLDFFKWIFATFVYYPQLNLLYFFNTFTNDIGVSIILVAITVNMLLWPVIVNSYLSGQKMRLLGKQTKEIQNKYKIDTTQDAALRMSKMKEMRIEMSALYKKHNIKTGVLLQVVFFQLFFASGVYYVVNNVSESVKNGGVAITGIYQNIFGVSQYVFPASAFFNTIKIYEPSLNYIFLPIMSLVLSYLYGMYSFKWAPNAKLPITSTPVEKTTPDEIPGLDVESIQKNQEIMIIYVMPVITFAINASFSAGLNLYFAILSLFNLVRQIIISRYYASHIDKLMQELAQSDPALDEFSDKSQNNEIDSIDVNIIAQKEIPSEIIKSKKTKKSKKN